MDMKPKYNLTVEENIFVAKRNLVDYIWKSARLEGINVTFPQTYAILEKAKVSDVNVEDILKITNLKHAWERLLKEEIGQPLDIDFFCRINGDVARDEALKWGTLRTGKVYISGTGYVPPVPDRTAASEQLDILLMIENPTERAIEVMLWGMKSQLFWDGNKRTSSLAANKIMIENGCGIISIPNDHLEKFNELLCDFYSNDTLEAIKEFVYENCIDGISFEAHGQKLEESKADVEMNEEEEESKPYDLEP